MISKKIQIPFHLCDPARIMFFGAYLEIYHMFLEESLPQMGIAWKTWFMGQSGSPVRGLQVQYDHSLAFGNEYKAQLSVIRLGETSVTFKFETKSENKSHAVAEVTHVFVNFDTREKIPIPIKIRSALEEHLEAPSS